MNQKDILDTVFTRVFDGKSQSTSKAQQLYRLVLDNIAQNPLASKEERNQILKKLPSAISKASGNNKYFVTFFSCFSCCVIFGKQSQYSKMTSLMLVPSKMEECFSPKDFKLKSIDPHDFAKIILPKTSTEEDLTAEFVKKKSEQIWVQTLRLQERMSGTVTKQAIRFTNTDDMESRIKQKGDCRLVESVLRCQFRLDYESQKNNLISRTAQVSNNMAWYLVIVLLKCFLSKKEYQMAIVNFKLSAILRYLKAQKTCDNKEVSKLKRCLDEVIHNFKHQLSHIKMKSTSQTEQFKKHVQEVYQNLIMASGGRWTSRFIGEHLSQIQHKAVASDLSFKTESKPPKAKFQVKPKTIPTYFYQVKNRRYLFTQLLEARPKKVEPIEYYNQAKFYWIRLVEEEFFILASHLTGQPHKIDVPLHPREVSCEFDASPMLEVLNQYQEYLKETNTLIPASEQHSHCYLLYYIAGFVCFEVVSKSREKTKTTLQKYRCPFDKRFQQFHYYFVSSNSRARIAMQTLNDFWLKIQKKKQFLKYTNYFTAYKDNTRASMSVGDFNSPLETVLRTLPADMIGLFKTIFKVLNKSVRVGEKKPQTLPEPYVSQQQFPQIQKLSFHFSKTSYKIYFNDVSQSKLPPLLTHIFEAETDYYAAYPELNDQLKCFQVAKAEDKNNNRQHRIYSIWQKRPPQLTLDLLHTLGNIRTAHKTQPYLLMEAIINKKIFINLQGKMTLQQLITRQAGGQVSSYDFQNPQLGEVIVAALKSFYQKWDFRSYQFSAIVGPLLGCLVNQLRFNKYIKDKQQRKLSESLINCSKLCLQGKDGTVYQCYSALALLRELSLVRSEDHLYLLQLAFRYNKVKELISEDYKGYVPNKQNYELLQLLRKHIVELNTLFTNQQIKKVEALLHAEYPTFLVGTSNWTKHGDYEWRCQNGKALYQIDLSTGAIYINGRVSESAIVKKIKEYKSIFGNASLPLVEHETNVYIANVNYKESFDIAEEKINVFFKFDLDSNSISYLVIDQAAKTEEEWSLLPQFEQRSDFLLPSQIQDYFAWHCEKKGTVIIRKRSIAQIGQVGVVLKVKELDKAKLRFKVQDAYMVKDNRGERHVQKRSYEQLITNKSQNYDYLILRKNGTDYNQFETYRVLSKLQDWRHINELTNRATKRHYFQLPRLKLEFNYQEDKLYSNNYFSYFVDSGAMREKDLVFNKINAFIFTKAREEVVGPQRMILLKRSPNRFFKYDVHDFFGDVRGDCKQASLLYAKLMLQVNNRIRVEGWQMTPVDVAMKSLRASLTVSQISIPQMQLLCDIQQMAKKEDELEVLFFAKLFRDISKQFQKVIFNTSHQLLLQKTKIEFQEKPYCDRQKKDKIFQQFYKKTNAEYCQMAYIVQRFQSEIHIDYCETAYCDRLKKDQIVHYLKIQQQFLGYLNINLEEHSKKHKKKKKQKKEGDDEGHSNEEQKEDSQDLWRNLKPVKGVPEQKLHQLVMKVDQFQKKRRQILDCLGYDKPQKKKQAGNFPVQISEAELQNNILKELLCETEQSYKVYMSESQRTQAVTRLFEKSRDKVRHLVDSLLNESRSLLRQLEIFLLELQKELEEHLDVVSGICPMFSLSAFTQVLSDRAKVQVFFPNIQSKADVEKVLRLCRAWYEISINKGSLQRMKAVVAAAKLDIVTFEREILSPRDSILLKSAERRIKDYWLAYEVENNMQLWQSQLQTYETLMQGKKGAFCQLNMGEGKTQVIIPMIILECIFGGRNMLPRVVLLQSLFKETQKNFYRFLTASNFHLLAVQVPFNRNFAVQKQDYVRKLKHLFQILQRGYLLMTSQSVLSSILKFREAKLPSLINPERTFDILDEIDQLMSPKRSYIYSIGKSKPLEYEMIRYELAEEVLESFIRLFDRLLKLNYVDISETLAACKAQIGRNQFPFCLRLNFRPTSREQILEMRMMLLDSFMQITSNLMLQKYKQQGGDKLAAIKRYVVDMKEKEPSGLGREEKVIVNLLRGYFAYGILQHALGMRYGVTFGPPSPRHRKKISVPYEEANVPSQTNQFEQPDLSILLTYLSYYNHGLSQQNFTMTLRLIHEQESPDPNNPHFQLLQTLLKVDYENQDAVRAIHEQYKFNKFMVGKWLKNLVLPEDLKQYSKSIMASAWDISHTNHAVGFSGTKDSHFLFPLYSVWSECKSDSIRATDGQMISLVTRFTTEVLLVQEDQHFIWKRFFGAALERKADCFIDAGAVCVGVSIKDVIVPWLAAHPAFDNKFKGITFCNNDGNWQTLILESNNYVARGSSLPDHNTFVIYDEARTRGADLKLDENARAAFTLSTQMTKDKFMQAVGRLRKFGRNQSLFILATQSVFEQILGTGPDKVRQKLKDLELGQTMKCILRWVLKNSGRIVRNLMVLFAQYGVKHAHFDINKVLKENLMATDPTSLYGKNASKSQAELLLGQISKYPQPKHDVFDFVTKLLKRYSIENVQQASGLENVCQREKEVEVEVEVQHQKEVIKLSPVTETDTIKHKDSLSLGFTLKQLKLRVSQNWHNTTTPQLVYPQSYFLTKVKEQLVALSLREANEMINQRGVFVQTSRFLDKNPLNKGFEKERVVARFLAGEAIFSVEETIILAGYLKQQLAQWKHKFPIQQAVLVVKESLTSRFRGSSLEKVSSLFNLAS